MKSKSNGRAAAAKGKVGQPSRGNIFEQMIENSPLNFIRADSDMIIRYINPASRTTLAKVAQLLPCKVEDVVGSNIDIFHKNPAHQRRMMADPRNLPHRVDIRLGPETLNLILSAIYDDAKNYTGALVCWEIVTERVREAADNVGQLAAIGKSQAVIEFKMDGTIVTANENFLHAMGYTLEEIKGKHHSLFVEEGYRQSAAYREFWAKLNRGEYEAGEFKRIGKGGKEVWIQASYNPILDGDGKPFKVVKYATDITQQKLTNADYAGQIGAIGKSQAVIEFKMDGTILTANDNFLRVLGYTLDEVKGRHHSMFVDEAYRNSPDYREFWAKLNRGEFVADEFKRIGKGGKEAWIQASYNPILDLNGKPFKVVKYASDLTPQKLALNAMISDVSMLSQAAVEGKLATRADAGKHSGQYQKIVQGFNETLDAVIVPLNLAARYVDMISKGETPPQITENYQGEFNTIKNNLNALVASMNEITAAAEEIANGNLTVAMKERSPQDKLMQALASMVSGITRVVLDIRTIASEVASASGAISTTSVEVSKGASSQAASAEQASSSMEQMVSNIKQNADSAQQTDKIANKSANDAQESGKSVVEAVAAMKEIASRVSIIEEIARQTNLLALNAAIEAARAGEHGLGFAVVADEVRKLAEKSAQSTKEISELIQSIQKEARKAVENMDRSTGIVNEGLDLGGELNSALRKISNVVTEVYKFAQEIGAATNEQSHGSSQIARATTRLNEITHEINSAVEEQASGAQAVVKAMERMRELVQQSTSGSTELAASAEQMSKMSRGLLDFMDRFTLDESSSSRREEPDEKPQNARRATAGSRN